MNQELKNKIEELFNNTPEDVHSVSYGYKYKNGVKTDQLGVIFTVLKKKPLSEIPSNEVLPNNVQAGGQTFVTDVVENDIATYMTCWASGDPNILRLQGNPSFLSPMKGGQEIIQFPTNWTSTGGGGWSYDVGTLGLFCVDNQDDKLVGLTNSHVVCYRRVYGDEVNMNVENADPYNTIEERVFDFTGGGYSPGALALNGNSLVYPSFYIKRYQNVSNTYINYVDGALMIMNNTPGYIDANSYQVWQPIGDPDYTPYMPFATTAEIDNLLSTNPYCYSTGRTTGPKGYSQTATCTLLVTEIGLTAYVSDGVNVQAWGDCIKFAYSDNSADPVAGGDSGSVLQANIGGVRKIIGLVFAGSGVGKYGLANRIDRVASSMNIRAWDASYTLNLNIPTVDLLEGPLSLGYGGIQSFVLNGKTYYQVGFTQSRNYPTLQPVPSSTPTPTMSPSPSPSPTPSPTPSATPYVLRDTWAWGNNADGQLGNNTVIVRSSPVLVQSSGYQYVPYGANALGALGINGNMYAWANNSLGQLGITSLASKSLPTQVPGSWSQVSINSTSSGIRTDGTLWAWGSNGNGACAQNSSVTNYSSPVQIGSGTDWQFTVSRYTPNAMMAIKKDGTLWGAGANTAGQLGISTAVSVSSIVQSGANSNWLKVQLGNEFAIGLRTDGTIWSVGNGGQFNLGTGSTLNCSSWIQVGTANNWIDISCKNQPVLALNNMGELYVWGSGGSGATGLNSIANAQSPTLLMSNVAWFSAGVSFCSAIKGDNTLWVWGINTSGRLGLNNAVNVSSPTQVGASADWWGVEANFDTIQAWKAAAPTPTPTPLPLYDLWAWGTGAGGQLGNDSAAILSSPTFVRFDFEYTPINAVLGTMYQARKDGSLWGWGTGSFGQLNNSVNITRSSPTQIGTDTDWLFATSTGTAGALKTNGTLWMYGNATNGALGDGQSSASRNSPVQLGEANWTAFATGSTNQYCLGIKNDGTLWGWGQNSNACYGNGTVINASSPVQVDTNTDWLGGQIAPSVSCVFIRKTNGTLWCTGVNSNGVLGLGSTGTKSSWTQVGTNSNWTQVSCNGNNAYGIKNDGSLWAWGTNTVGQLGLNDVTNRNSPVQVGTSTDWSVIYGANQLAYAIKKNGTLWAWGLNTSGQLGTGNVLGYSSPVQTILADSNWINLAAGNNGVVAYRYNTAFITPTPTPTPTPT